MWIKLPLILGLAVIFVASFSDSAKAAINTTVNFQGKLVNISDGTNLQTGTPACVQAGADTCDFRVRIWNHPTDSFFPGPDQGNIMFSETFQDVEIGDYEGIFNLVINSCGSSDNGVSQWGTSVGNCTVYDDYSLTYTDTDPGVNFDRDDLWVEISFADADTSGSLGSFSETFTRTQFRSVPSAMMAKSLSGISADGFVQFAPDAAQASGDTSNPLIFLNENGVNTPNLLQLQRSGSNRFVVTNEGEIQSSGSGDSFFLGSLGIGTLTPDDKVNITHIYTESTARSAIGITSSWAPQGGTSSQFPSGISMVVNYNSTFNSSSPSFLTGYRSFASVINTGTIDIRNVDLKSANTSTGSVTTARDIVIRSAENTGGGTIGTYYGLYISEQTAATDNFAIYTAGGTKSYFGGRVSINSNTSPASQLMVTRSASAVTTAEFMTGLGSYSYFGHDSGNSNTIQHTENGYTSFEGYNTLLSMTYGPALYIDGSTNNVGIGGTTSPTGQLEVIGVAGNTIRGILSSQFNDTISGPNITFQKARGSLTTPAAVQLDDVLGNLQFAGYDGTAFSSSTGVSTQIRAFAAENWTDTAHGSYMIFETVEAGTITRSERMRITAAGDVGIGTGTVAAKLHILTDGQEGLRYIDSIGGNTHLGWDDGNSNYITHSTAGFTAIRAYDPLGSGHTSPQLYVRGSDGAVGINTTTLSQQLTINGDISILDGGTEVAQIRAGGNVFDIDPVSISPTGANTIRMFRVTNTTGTKGLQLHRGDGTTAADTFIGVDGTNSYFQTNGGNVGFGTTNPISPFYGTLGTNLDVVGTTNAHVSQISVRGPDTSGQGSGIVFVGQSNQYGGGIVYNGSDTPDMPTSVDYFSLFVRSAGVNTGVLEWSHNSTTAQFRGNAHFNNNFVTGVNEIQFNSGSNHSIGSDVNGLLFDGGDGQADLLIYDNTIYSDTLRLGYSGNATITTHDTNENLILTTSGTGIIYSQAHFSLKSAAQDLYIYDGNGKLHILGDTASGQTSGITLRDTSSSTAGAPIFSVQSSGYSERLRVEHNGYTSTTNSFKASGIIVAGTLPAAGFIDTCFGGGGAGDYQLAGCTSSIKFKKNVEDLELGLETIRQLRPVTFDWKSNDMHDLGFIAEEVVAVDPILGTYIEGELKGVQYKQLTAVLSNAVVELDNSVQLNNTFRNTYKADLPKLIADYKAGILGGANVPKNINTETITATSITTNTATINGLLTANEVKMNLITAKSTQDIIVKLAESMSATSFAIENSNGERVLGIDSNGKITIKADSENTSVGTAAIEAGQKTIKITTTAITESSKVFVSGKVTSSGVVPLLGVKELIYDETTDEYGFVVEVGSVEPTPIEFDWWVIN